MSNLWMIERRGALRIILFLAKHGRQMISKIKDGMEGKIGQSALYNAIRDLQEAGIVQEERDPALNRRWISLTDSGQHIAPHVEKIRRILDVEI